MPAPSELLAATPMRLAPDVAVADRFLVPLDHPGAMAYFTSHLRVAHRASERLRAALATHGAGSVIGSRALSRRQLELDPSDRRFSSALALIEASRDLIESQLAMASRSFRWILLADYGESRRERATIFLFGPEDPAPRMVVKLRTVRAEGRSLSDEWDALQLLESTLPDLLIRSVPAPLGFVERDGIEMLALSTVPGRSAYVEMQNSLLPSRSVGRHFAAAAEWLAAFQNATERHDELELDESPALTSLSEHERDEISATLRRHPIRLTASHGDFWARNVLLHSSGGEVKVVDWEHFAASAAPLGDLFHFPLTYTINYPWRRFSRVGAVEAFRNAFLNESVVARGVRNYLHIFCSRRGIDPAVLGSWFRLHLRLMEASTSNGHSERHSEQGGGYPWRRFHEMLDRAENSVFSG
ncbi:MAG TPA: phosphotransferase [Thermoanaerobaculia bacterium]|nr:phosphotransferase [Thermoanaerobaculia bacterium]